MANKLRDRLLVRRFLKTNDEQAFVQLYRAHTGVLYQSALRFLSWKESDAQDAVQETWIRAVQRLSDFRWQSQLRTWLFAILVRCCREVQRRNPNYEELSVIHEPSFNEVREEHRHLEAAISKLSPGYRNVFILHDIEGYTHQEIAQMLEIDPGTSKSQLFHARKILRENLSGKEEEKHAVPR